MIGAFPYVVSVEMAGHTVQCTCEAPGDWVVEFPSHFPRVGGGWVRVRRAGADLQFIRGFVSGVISLLAHYGEVSPDEPPTTERPVFTLLEGGLGEW